MKAPDIKDNTTLNQNFREKFEALNRVKLTDNICHTTKIETHLSSLVLRNLL
jgi:hypothetical protein